ncbi:ankyrin repeat-containing domain protein [Nemania sp. FL0031]|nr:ankyrin repeat-containing domain protein [Nemania sp. FL0031]
MCRVLVFFNCLHQSVNILDIEDRLARLLYGLLGGPSTQIQHTIATLPSLATSIVETNESFVKSKFILWGHLVSIYKDTELGLWDSQMLEHQVGPKGFPFEYRIIPSSEGLFVPKLLPLLHKLMVKRVPANSQSPAIPFDIMRALLSLATPTEPFTVAGSTGSPIELFDKYLDWLDPWKTAVLYVHASKNTDDLVRRTSEYVFLRREEIHRDWRSSVSLYYSFDSLNIASQSLSSMILTFFAQIYRALNDNYIPFFLHRIYEERACTEKDLLNWFEFWTTASHLYVRLIINYFDVCPEVSRNIFLQFVKRNAMGNETPVKVLLTSREPSILKAELSSWPSIDLGTDISPSKNQDKAEHSIVIQGQIPGTIPESCPTLPTQETMMSSLTLVKVAKASDALVQSILLEQQLKRNLSVQEILIESTNGVLDAYTLEEVVDRVLRSIPDQNKARTAVAFLVFATRPLSSKEFATLFFLGSTIDNGEPISSTWGLFERLERQRTAWFSGITVNRHIGVCLAHPRLEDMLRSPSTGAQHYLWHEVASTAHYDIAYICLDYLARTSVQEEQDLLSKQSFITDADLGFISYAVQYWPYHFSLAKSSTEKEAMKSLYRKMAEVDLERWSRTAWLLSNPFSRSRKRWKSPLVALISLGYPDILKPVYNTDLTLETEEAARAGNVHLVNSLLEMEGQCRVPRFHLVTLIIAATSGGNESLAIRLIDRLSIEDRDELSQRGKMSLFRAARLGLDRLAERLLEIGTPVDSKLQYFNGVLFTPLCFATSAGHVSTVKILLRYGADVEFTTNGQRTPLLRAIEKGNADIVQCLVEQGGVGITSVTKSLGGLIPLCLACLWGKPRVAEKLLELGADIDQTDDSGWPPIIIAAYFGHWQVVQILLDHGVDIETSTSEGDGTALLYALTGGHTETCRQLLGRGANPSSPLFRSSLLILWVSFPKVQSEASKISFAKVLLDYNININATGHVTGASPLTLACASGQFRLARFLLGFNPDINIADRDGRTALFEATKAQFTPLVKILLERGADANMATSMGHIPLHMCQDSPELTRLLVEHTRDIDLPMAGGATQLMLAALRGWTESVKILLEHKANVNAVVTRRNQRSGWTAVMFAAYHNFAGIITILAEAGADLKKQNANGASPLHLIFKSSTPEGVGIDCLNALMEFQARIDINQTNKDGETVLHHCAEIGHLKAVQRLVRAGASLNHKDKSGYTALSQAVWHEQHEVVSYLLEHGADPNIVGSDLGFAETPLFLACLGCDYAMAKMLIDYGADLNYNSVSGYGSPLMVVLASLSENQEDPDKLTQHLLDHGADININSRYLGSPLAAAAWLSRPGIVRSLLNKGALHDVEDVLKRRPIHFAAMNGELNFRIIEEGGAKLTDTDILGRSVLHYAAQGGRLQVIKRIFEVSPKLDVNVRDIDGWTPLCWVARGSTRQVMDYRASEPTDMVGVVKDLLERGADRFVECKIGDETWTPLRIFRHAGAPEEVTALLRPETEPNTNEATDTTGELSQQAGELVENALCEACFWEIHDTYYKCEVCHSYKICSKCWHHRDLAHEFNSHWSENSNSDSGYGDSDNSSDSDGDGNDNVDDEASND